VFNTTTRQTGGQTGVQSVMWLPRWRVEGWLGFHTTILSMQLVVYHARGGPKTYSTKEQQSYRPGFTCT